MSSLALISFLAGTSAGQDGKHNLFEGKQHLVDEKAIDQDLIPSLEPKNAGINFSPSSDEVPGSTTSTETTCELAHVTLSETFTDFLNDSLLYKISPTVIHT